MNVIVERILNYITTFLALIVVLSLHEFAHAFAAVKCGDNTPKIYKRYTINPLAHFDLIGLACFLFAGFGWSKPVPVNPNNFKKYKTGCFFVAIAGISINLITSFLIYPLAVLSFKIPDFGYFTYALQETLSKIFIFGITFSLFNILPIFPLDGFRVVDVFNKKRGPIYRFLRNYGRYILFALFALSIVADFASIPQLDILGTYISFVSGYVAMPTTLFWGLFF